jgi:5,6-dimethylbenzimidazole synthase
MTSKHSYSDIEKKAIEKVMTERRDVRHFTTEAIDSKTFHHILSAAHKAPSVGLMQPWRFIHVKDMALRKKIHSIVEQERQLTADALNERKSEFLSLKVEGVLQCAEIVIAALPDKREQHIFGRRTLPEMDLASLACGIQNMWLTARAEGIGMGWVSLFDPNAIKHLFNMPDDSHPIAILCIGHVDTFYEKPMLVMEEWTQEKAWKDMLFIDQWDNS